MVLRKDQLEVQLKDEHQQIQDGVLKDESPLDDSPEFFDLCHSCRIGDLKGCQEAIDNGININARDKFDYTPLILVRLCHLTLPHLPLNLNLCMLIYPRQVSAATMKSYSFFWRLVPFASEIPFKAKDASTMH